MPFFSKFLFQTWGVITDMAPYLLLGFLAAGALHVLITPSFVRRHLGSDSFTQIVKATLFGIPIPLCSCGVIPVAASLRKSGAGKGATAAFLASTPQTGADSILVTYALMGPIFTWFRVFTSAVTGIVSGVSIDWLTRNEEADSVTESPPIVEDPNGEQKPVPHKIASMLQHGFVTLPSDIGGAVLLGLVISGALGAAVPPNFFADTIGQGFFSLLVMLIVGIPIYVCSTASIPIALSLLSSGISPGGALVFLISGPATNTATFTTLWTIIGRRATLIYLGMIALCALGAGLLLDVIITSESVLSFAPHHEHAPSLLQHISAGILLGLLVAGKTGWMKRFAHQSETL